MKNPFDQAFFRFLLGFSIILATSFIIIFITGHYSSVLDEQKAAIFNFK